MCGDPLRRFLCVFRSILVVAQEERIDCPLRLEIEIEITLVFLVLRTPSQMMCLGTLSEHGVTLGDGSFVESSGRSFEESSGSDL